MTFSDRLERGLDWLCSTRGLGCLLLLGGGFIAAVIAHCVWDACTKPTSGVVVTKKFVPSHTDWIWISNGKGGGFMSPVFYGDDWELLIDGDGDQRTAWVPVSPSTYEAVQVGSRWAAEVNK